MLCITLWVNYLIIVKNSVISGLMTHSWFGDNGSLKHRKIMIITTYSGSSLTKTLYQRNPQIYPQKLIISTVVDKIDRLKSVLALG